MFLLQALLETGAWCLRMEFTPTLSSFSPGLPYLAEETCLLEWFLRGLSLAAPSQEAI